MINLFKLSFTVLTLLIFVQVSPVHAQSETVVPANQIRISKENGEVLVFDVELAVTSSEQEKGLMNRTFLPEESGMLFLFGSEGKRTFWMKDTLIPLDMLFLAKDGTINHIHHMAKAQDETLITSDRPAAAVLEINGGLSGKLGIEEGDKVLHPAFRNAFTGFPVE